MGHVSDFNGMNSCGEAELNHANSELMSADSILDLPLNENFMPIYNSFPDDIYRQPNLYSSNNLTSFMNNDDDRNEYFDEPLELDLLFDSSFNIDFNTSADILENNSPVEQNSATSNFDEINVHEGDKNTAQFKHEIGLNSTSVQNFISKQALPQSGFDFQESHVNTSSNSNSSTSSAIKSFTTETVFNDHKSCNDVKEHIPKLVIKLKSDSESTDQTSVFTAMASAPLTIADDVKLGRQKNGSVDCNKVARKKVKNSKKHKKHKKKSSRLKKHHKEIAKDEVVHQNFSGKFSNCNSQSGVCEITESNQTDVNRNSFNSNSHSLSELNNSNYQLPNCNDENSSSSHNASFVSDNSHVFHNIETEPLDNEILENLSDASIAVSANEDYEFEKDNSVSPSYIKEAIDSSEKDNSVSPTYIKDSIDSSEKDNSVSPTYIKDSIDSSEKDNSVSPTYIKEVIDSSEKDNSVSPTYIKDAIDSSEKDNSVSPTYIKEDIDSSEDFLENIDNNSLDHQSIPDINESLQENFYSTKSESSTEESSVNSEKPDCDGSVHNKDVFANEPKKSDLASDLIEELNAHHQQVFEEIEISTPDLELELNEVKNCSDNNLKASQQSPDSANDNTVRRTKNLLGDSENIHSSNDTLANKISSHNVSHSVVTINSSSVRTKSILENSGSSSSKSSASHRSYRKRRRSSSSSSSCSDKEKFYNRPVKFDPVTQTYCDEFGREIRSSELKYYLKSKSNCHDSYANNGSSSSSRSKSPRYRNHHKKHHKPRSGSRSHKRRRHSSSRSRSRSKSRSHGRRYKDDYNRKYRSPSPKHRTKRHYLDVEENMRAYEERRVMYVGDIPPDYTVEQLKERFVRFGPIQNASIKSKITADGSLYIFGFVTFKNRADVCQAIERGNENPSWPRFDLNFGGRRRFCNGNYTDLDGKVAEAESGWYSHNRYRKQPSREEDDFAELLRQEQRRLGMTKK